MNKKNTIVLQRVNNAILLLRGHDADDISSADSFDDYDKLIDEIENIFEEEEEEEELVSPLVGGPWGPLKSSNGFLTTRNNITGG